MSDAPKKLQHYSTSDIDMTRTAVLTAVALNAEVDHTLSPLFKVPVTTIKLLGSPPKTGFPYPEFPQLRDAVLLVQSSTEPTNPDDPKPLSANTSKLTIDAILQLYYYLLENYAYGSLTRSDINTQSLLQEINDLTDSILNIMNSLRESTINFIETKHDLPLTSYPPSTNPNHTSKLDDPFTDIYGTVD